MDEDEDEDDENDVSGIEEMMRNVNSSLDQELIGGSGGSALGGDEIKALHNMSIASFIDEIGRQDSPDTTMLSPNKPHGSMRTSFGSR